MKKFLSLLFFVPLTHVFAALSTGVDPDNRLFDSKGWFFLDVLIFIEKFLLKVALPLVVVGAFLYIAWELLTAEGNEEKMKKAWKAVTYTAIGLLMIALAYAIVAMASRLSL